jgi:hypothetical protein
MAEVSGGGVNSPGAMGIAEVELIADHPCVTLVMMIAPSPDWFVGIDGEPMLDKNGQWVPTRTLILYPYDAGTDRGTDYISADDDTDPTKPIVSLRGQVPFSDEPIGTFTLRALRDRLTRAIYR